MRFRSLISVYDNELFTISLQSNSFFYFLSFSLRPLNEWCKTKIKTSNDFHIRNDSLVGLELLNVRSSKGVCPKQLCFSYSVSDLFN